MKRLALAAVALLSLGASAPPAARTTPIIDVHVHAYTEDPRFGSTWTNPLTGEVLKAAAGPDAHREEVHAAFERFRVIRAVTSGGDREAVIDWHRRDPRRILVGHAFDDPEQASAIIDEIAGDDGPFRDFTVTRSQSFGETSFTVEGVADFSDGLASFTDERVSELLGDGFGGNLDQIEDDTGAPAAEQVSVTFAAELPGGGTEVFELDPTSTEAQPIEAESTSTRWAARAWAVVAALVIFARQVKPLDRKASIAIHSAFGTQILLGIAVVMTGMNIVLAVLHQAVGALVVASVTWGAHVIGRRS